MTDCTHREWGVRYPDGHVVPAASEAGAALLVAEEDDRAGRPAGCVVVNRHVQVQPWSEGSGTSGPVPEQPRQTALRQR